MKIILALGAPGGGHDEVFATLVEAGVAAAKPSRRENHSPQALTQLMLQAMEVDPIQDSLLEQLRPGRFWQDLAADLAIANLQQPVWGWADPQLMRLLDFWQDFDPQVRVLLVYGSPADYLVARFRGVREPRRAELEAALREWQSWNIALLRYHLRHPDHSLLVEARTALEDTPALLQLLRESWKLGTLKQAASRPAPDPQLQAVLTQAACGLIPAGHKAWDLLEQIESVAQLPARNPGEATSLDAWSAAVHVGLALGQARQAAEGVALQLRAALAAETQWGVERQAWLQERLAWDKERQSWAAQGKVAEAERQALAAERRALAAERLAREQDQQKWAQERDELHRATQEALGRLAAPAVDHILRQENDQLNQQLRQVQQELRRSFVQCKDLQARVQSLTDLWIDLQPDVLTLDIRRPILGDQWHEPEPDGRWTGPANVSKLELPPLRPGSYTLTLDVAGSMAPDLLETAQIEFEGKAVSLDVEYLGHDRGFPAVCTAQVHVNGTSGQASHLLGLKLPRTESPSASGSPDQRQLGVRIKQLRLIRNLHGAHAVG